MGGSPGITELMARLLREVEGGSAVRARFVGDGVSASGRGLCGRLRERERGADRGAGWAGEAAGRAGPRGIGPRMGFAGPSGKERGVWA
jgi:hypothetical protein